MKIGLRVEEGNSLRPSNRNGRKRSFKILSKNKSKSRGTLDPHWSSDKTMLGQTGKQYIARNYLQDKAFLIDYYEELLKDHGAGYRAVGWGSVEAQLARFEKMLPWIIDPSVQKFSMLDVGCGLGDLYGYLCEQGLVCEYTGVDICAPFIELAQKRYPKARFLLLDLLVEDLPELFDYVLASGTFNSKLRDNWAFLRLMLEKMFTLCQRGVAANMLRSKVDYREDHLFYYDPQLVLDMCHELTDNVTLYEDYGLYEFTVLLHKEAHEKGTHHRQSEPIGKRLV